MNSVLEIGENILFIHEGVNKWVGSKNNILDTSVQELHDFIYVSKFLKQLKRH
jgi:phospholipid/cholesterol/gamma-HCH transport system ATP-binding protein